MNFAETLKLAFSAIWAHKLRSFLTLFGMIIGVMTFMIVMSVLIGFIGFIDEKIAGIGSNSFTVRRFSFDDFKDTDTVAAAQRRNKELSFDELYFIRDHAQLVDKIGARAGNVNRDIKRGDETLSGVQIEGDEPIIADIEKMDITDGRYFTDTENTGAAYVAFIGADVVSKLFPGGHAVGGEITIQGIPYRVIGVLKAKGTVFGRPQDNFVQLPIKTFGKAFGGLRFQRAPYFEVTSKNDKVFNDCVEEVRQLMRIKRKLASDEKDNFGLLTPDAITGVRDRILGPTLIVVAIVPTIALVVGAIVIMNIMLVAVTERTKEIGVRKSLGARQRDILRQFLFEAASLASLGGLIGLILAYLAGIIVTRVFFPTSIPWWAAVLAIAVSGGIGIAAGLFPAWKAARLDPIEALRYE
jgi:putative ABC transport system permease protein